MRKNLALRLVPLIALAIGLQSCRTNEDYLSGNENPSYSKKFQVFSAANKESVNYAQGFRTLLENYDDINGTSYTRASLLKKGNFNKNESEYVQFNLHSQEMLLDDGERWVIYPIIKNNQVDGLMAGILRNEETEVEFRKLDSGNAYYDEVHKIFSIAYTKNKLKNGLNSKDGCGFEEDDACGIPDIIISPPPKPRPGGSGPKGGCTGYNNCMDPSAGNGGGNSTPTPEQPVNPCEKMKAQNLSTAYKGKVEELDKPSVLSQKKETGFLESKSGVFTNLSPAASTATSDGLSVTIAPDTKGYIHTHLNDYETGDFNDEGLPIIKQPIRMFSPSDVNTLMTMAGYITDGNYSDLYGTMVSSYGNYTIMFTGTASDIKTGFDTEQWKLDYIAYREKHDLWTFEKLFLNFLKDKMNVKGVALYKIKDNGTIQKKTLNSNNNIQSSDCPQ